MTQKKTANNNGDVHHCIFYKFCALELSAVANMQQVVFQQDRILTDHLLEIWASLDEQYSYQWILAL